MDFARKIDSHESIVTRSNIRHIPLPPALPPAGKEEEGDDNTTKNKDGATTNDDDNEDEQLDRMVIQAGNDAAAELFLGPDDADYVDCDNDDDKTTTTTRRRRSRKSSRKNWSQEELQRRVNCSLYTERMIPVHTLIKVGDLVVIMESFDKLNFLYVRRGSIFQNKNGAFHHDDFIDMPYGSKIRSRNNRGYGFIYVLRPTPELWTRSLVHRTQIVHELDQSQIVFQLQLRPNMTVVESGTGSGAMSHAILRTIAPHGHLHTYEFNAARVETARQEFTMNGVSHLVSVHHRDVCATASSSGANAANEKDKKKEMEGDDVNSNKEQGGGFNLPQNSVDAVFLDLPEPWLAVPHAAYVLKPNSRIASYSPCVEQTQRTCEALTDAGFHSVRTFEYRLQEHYVDRVEYEPPPSAPRPRPKPNPKVPVVDDGDDDNNNNGDHDVVKPNKKRKLEGGGGDGGQDDDVVEEKTNSDVKQAASTQKEVDKDKGRSNGKTNVRGGGGDNNNNSNSNKEEEDTSPFLHNGSMIVARPYSMMRGHSAFLTFATNGW